MKLRITPAIQYECENAIVDATQPNRGDADPSDGVYLKIHASMEAKKGVKAVVIDADGVDIRELKSRAEYEVGPNVVCAENIADCYEFSERAYWLGRQRAYKALLKQING